jgi:2-iminobutanoate/2-iminopropanoate deaminase
MEHEVIHAPSMPQPMGHYSQAVRVGNLLFVAGQPGIDLGATADPDTARAVPGGFEAEFRQAVRNLEAVLKAAGSDL